MTFPRKLTTLEIEQILTQLTYQCVHPDVSESVNNIIRDRYKKQLITVEIYPEMIPEFTTTLIRQYHTSHITPGECVGMLTAQSIGERNTQLTLDSFHKSGTSVATVIQGVPRFAELMGATKKPKGPLTTIFFNRKYTSLDHVINDVYLRLIETTIGDITEELIRRRPMKTGWRLVALSRSIDIPEDYVCLTFRLKQHVLYDRRLTLTTISKSIEEAYPDFIVIVSPIDIGIIDVWLPSKQHTDKFIKKFMGHCIQGVKRLTTISYIKGKEKGEYQVEMSGYNLPDLFQLDIVDATRTVSNHIWEVYEMLGVEAVREFLIKEFIKVISADSYINVRHIQLMVDLMTFAGGVSSISRFGFGRNSSGPIAKASFEKTVDNFLKSAVFGEVDNTIGVSASIVCGKPSIAGTGLCELIYSNNNCVSG